MGDLLRYAAFHLGDGTVEGGEALLSKDSLELMRSPQVELTETDAMGLTWMLRLRAGRPTVGHGGLTNGQAALLTLVPDAGFAVAV